MSKGADGPSAATFSNPRRSGWMHKHGGSGMSSHWRKRWFIVDHHYLFYYKGPNDKKPVGILCLPEYTSCHKVDSKEWKKPYTFMLDKGDGNESAGALKNYVLYAESEKDLDEWIKVLREEMQPVLGMSNGYPGRKGKDDIKIDQKAMDDVSKVVSEGPKLSHPTAGRPKVKGRRPPKKYQVFHEDDEDSESPPNTPQQRQPQPSSDSSSTSPSVSPSLAKKGHHPTVPLKPKARTSTVRVTEDVATESRTSPPMKKASKPLPAKPLPPKKPVKEPPDTALPAPLPQVSKSPEPAVPEAEHPPSPKIPLKPAPPKKPPKDGRLDVEQESELRNETKNVTTQKPVLPRKPRPQPPIKPRSSTSFISVSAEPPPTPTPSEPPTPTTPTPTPTPRPRPVPRKRTKDHTPDVQEEVAEIAKKEEAPVEKPITKVKSPEPPQPKEAESLPEEPPLIEESPPPLPTKTKPPNEEAAEKKEEEVKEEEVKEEEVKEEEVKEEVKAEEEKVKEEVKQEEEEEEEEKEEKEEEGEGIEPPITHVGGAVLLEENEEVISKVSPELQTPISGKPEESTPKEEGELHLTDESRENDGDRKSKAGSDEKQDIQSTELSSEAPLALTEEIGDLALYEDTPERKQIGSTNERVLLVLSEKSDDSSRDDDFVFSPSYEQMKPASPAKSQESANRLTSTEGEEDYEPMQSGVRISKESRSPVRCNVPPGYDKPTNWISDQRKSLEHQTSNEYELPPDAGNDYDTPPPPRPLSGVYESPSSCMAATDLEALKKAVGRNQQQQQQQRGETEQVPGATVSPSDSRSSSSCSGKLERDALGYTKVMKMKVSPSKQSDKLKPAFATGDDEDEQFLVPPELPMLQEAETVPDCLQQAKEILRLARIVKAEAEEMKKEVQNELALAKKERCDAELLKRNAAEILRMSKEKLKTAAIVSRH